MYVNWIKTTKKQDAEWYLNNSDDALTLRKEWLKSSITNRLNKYTTGGFKAEEEYNKWGKSEVHWGSDHRGKKWSEYLNKIDNLDIGDKSTEFSYLEVKDGLLVALAETLLPELITCNLAKDKNAKKADIINYLEINCSRAENNYYDREEGRIVKMKEKKWKNKSVREIVNSLN